MEATIPQTEALNERQALNNGGGFSFVVDDLTKLRRFLILGCEGGSYYASEKQLKLESAATVVRMIQDGQGLTVVNELKSISVEGRAPKQGPGIMALALCARLGDKETKQAAFAALPEVCRTGSTLFDFVAQCKALGKDVGAMKGEEDPKAKASWGRSMRHGIQRWYLDKDPMSVAYQVTKYAQRGGWSHRDLLRLTHPNPTKYLREKRKTPDTTPASGSGTQKKPHMEGDGDVLMEAGGEEVVGVGVSEGGEQAKHDVEDDVRDFELLFTYVTKGSLNPVERVPKAKRGVAQHAEGVEATVQHAGDKAAAQHDEGEKATAQQDEGVTTTAQQDEGVQDTAQQDDSDKIPAHAQPAADGSGSGSGAHGGDDVRLSKLRTYLQAVQRIKVELKFEQDPSDAAVKKDDSRPGSRGVDAGRGRGRGRGRGHGTCMSNDDADTEGEGDAATACEAPQSEASAAIAQRNAAILHEVTELVRTHRFTHEHIGDSKILKAPELWHTFLEIGMPLTAMLRSLARMTALGVMDSTRHRDIIVSKLASAGALHAARIHPIQVLDARLVYEAGQGDKGSLTWRPCAEVVDALEKAYYLSFKNVEPTGKRILIGVDVSGSMSCGSCQGMQRLTPRDAAAALAMTFVRTETHTTTMAFSSNFIPLNLTRDLSLKDVKQCMSNLPFDNTDCALPMLYALEKNLEVDTFIVLTDNETNCNSVHPVEALKQYREKKGIAAQLVVMAFAVNDFSVADPLDRGMLDVAGLDSSVPRIVAEFMMQKL